MADKLLKSITFPDLTDKYIVGDTTLSVAGAGADAKATGDALATKANIDGSYEDLTAGTANQINTSVRANDKTPYIFRTSGGSVDIGDREYVNGIVGGTVAWNQLIPDSVITAYGNKTFASGTSIVEGHKYAVLFDAVPITAGTTSSAFLYLKQNGQSLIEGASLVNNNKKATIYNATASGTADGNANSDNGIWVYCSNLTSSNFSSNYFNFIDLTQMFGSTVADYIYALETATAGAGVAWFRKLFNKPYYAYNAGELKSVSGLVSHDMTGFNQFDVSQSVYGERFTTTGTASYGSACTRSAYIPIFPNTTYYFKDVMGYADMGAVFWYDADKNYISANYISGASPKSGSFTSPANAYYVGVNIPTAYINSACINLSWDGSRDGEYEPYVKHSYPLDSDLTLRGIPKLDANNGLYYDGDTYEADGTVNRKMKSVTLTGQETVITSGAQGGFFSAHIYADAKSVASNNDIGNVISDKLIVVSANANGTGTVSNIAINTGGRVIVNVYGATSLAEWRTAVANMNATIVYELATPTTETADPYQHAQIVNDFGTEEYVISANTFAVPVGHDTDYPINMVAKLEMAPNSPSGDGDYIVRQTNGTNEYVSLSGNATIQDIISRLEALENA